MAEASESQPSQGVLSRAFAKRRRSENLDAEEKGAYQAYYRRLRELRAEFMWQDLEEKAAMREQAEADGYRSFSKWMRDMVFRGMSKVNRPLDEWQVLEARLKQTEHQLETQMDIAHQMVEKANRYERERDAASEQLRVMETQRAKQEKGPRDG